MPVPYTNEVMDDPWLLNRGDVPGPIDSVTGVKRLINVSSAKLLHNSGQAYSGGDGTGKYVITYHSASGANYQQWEVRSVGGGYYTLRSVQTGKQLHESSQTYGSNGRYTISYTPVAGADYQEWQITNLGSGRYRLTSRQTGKALTESSAAYSGDSAGRYVVTWPTGSGGSQEWQIVN